MERLGEVVIVGGSVAGRACALALARRGLPVTLVSESGLATRPGSDLASYRTWWPSADPSLFPFASRGVDLLEALWEESQGAFEMDRRGDLWLGGDEAELESLRLAAGRAALIGGGPLREHLTPEWYLPSPDRGLTGVPGGLDLIESSQTLKGVFPALHLRAAGGLHVRRAGGLEVAGFGRWLDRALAAEEVTVVADSVVELEPRANAHRIRLGSGDELVAVSVVLAADQRVTAMTRPMATGGPVGDFVRVVAQPAVWRPVPPGAPAVHCRHGEQGWIEIRANFDGCPTLTFTGTIAEAAGLADPASPILGGIERQWSGAVAGSGFLTTVSRLDLGTAGRPIVGPIGRGLLATAGHGGSVTSALAAAEIIAEYLLEGEVPDYGRAVGATID